MDSKKSNLPSVVQEELFDPSALPAGHELLSVDEREKNGKSTGERIAKDRKKYMAIVRCLAEGIGIRQTARAFGVSSMTVMAIRDREGLAIGTEKKELSAKMAQFVRLGVERLIEEVENIPIGQLSVSVGIIQDKKALLDGDPTAIIDHRSADEATVSADQVRDYLDRMKRAAVAVPGVLDVPSDLSSDGKPVLSSANSGV